MRCEGPTVVMDLPENLDQLNCKALLDEVKPVFANRRPCLVFDGSKVRRVDRHGLELLLNCLEEAMKRNGDVKLASVSVELAIMMELTKLDRLFETYYDCDSAIESYHRFSTRGLLRSRGMTREEPMVPAIRVQPFQGQVDYESVA